MSTMRRSRATGAVRTIRARELKAALRHLERGIQVIRLEMDHVRDNERITFRPRKRSALRSRSALETLTRQAASDDPLTGGTQPPRPKEPLCAKNASSPVTAGEIYLWMQVLQSRLDVCRIATRALGRDYVINPRRR